MTPDEKMTETEALVAELYRKIEEVERQRIVAWIKGVRCGIILGGLK